MSQKRRREDFSKEQVCVLDAAWNEGMTSAGNECREKIAEVASLLGISQQRVCVWIGNKRSKVKRVETGNPVVKKKKVSTRGPNAYSYFASTVEKGNMDGPSYLKMVGEKWREMLEEDKRVFFAEAKEIRQDPLKGKSRRQMVDLQMKTIENAINILSSLGYETCGLGFDPTGECEPTEFGSPIGIKFIDIRKQENFRTFLTGKDAGENPAQNKEDAKKKLRTEVRRKMNSAWVKATGSDKPVPYKDLKDKSCLYDLLGLPEGVAVNDPSCYGVTTLRTILSCDLKFKLREMSSNANQQSVTVVKPEKRKPSETTSTDTKKRKIQKNTKRETEISVDGHHDNADNQNQTEISVDGHHDNADNQNQTEISVDGHHDNTDNQNQTEISVDGHHDNADNQNLPDISLDDAALLTPLLIDPSTTELSSPSQDDIYEVEKILKRRKKGKKAEVLIKWKNYKETSWIPASDLMPVCQEKK